MKKIILPDERNENIQIYVGGQLFPRKEARISVFDSSVQGGDAVWEGMRVYKGRVFQMEAHLDRLMDSAKVMAFHSVPPREEITAAVFSTLKANNMSDEAHIRLTLTRGEKITSGMSPEFNLYGPCLIVLAEWKKPVYKSDGIKLVSSTIRRNPPQCIDSKIHHNNLINNILAKIEANVAGVDDAVMFDIYGFVSETNATNIFIVKNESILTPHPDSCLPGITRRLVMGMAKENSIPLSEKNISIAQLYSADEVFVTGSMGEITPVLEIDGRTIGNGTAGKMTLTVQKLFRKITRSDAYSVPIP